FFNKKLDGLDRSKPLGLYVLWPKKIDKLEDLQFPVINFVPVTNDKLFLRTLAYHGLTVNKGEGGTYKVKVNENREGTLKLPNDPAYAAFGAKWLEAPLPNPATFLPPEATKSVLVANLQTDRLPKEHVRLLDMVFAPFKELMARLADESKKKPGESEEQY